MTDSGYITMTRAELESFAAMVVDRTLRSIGNGPRKEVHRGISGIAEALMVSYSQAKRIKASGILNPVLRQEGRVIILTDGEKARQLYGAHGRTHSKNSIK